jgi:signal transduction histidine kinase
MTRPVAGFTLAAAAATVVALVSGIAHDAHAALIMAAIVLPVGAATVGGVELLLAKRARLRSIRRQLAIVGTLAIGQMLIVIGVLVGVMFVSAGDALFTALAAVYAGLIGAWAGHALARHLLGDIDEIRSGLSAVGAGQRELEIDVRGADELAQLAAEVELMVGRLAAEERARASAETAHRDLVAAVSHDLRTPLTSLRLLADALHDSLVDESQRREYLDRIGTHVRALSALIDDLFELSRLKAGEIRWTLEHVPLDELVRETVDAMRPHADASKVAVSAELREPLPAAQANPEQIQRVLFNLIQNAIRHTPADGSVTVRVEEALGAVEVEVADSGVGIDAAERDRVFEPFFQGAERASRSNGSAGLGLAISQAIVEAHGGRIWLVDASSGTRVRFRLPVAAPVAS